MRVKDYLTVVVVVSLVSAFLVERFVVGQSERAKAELMQEADIQRANAEFGYINTNISQFLLSADLVIGSGETYLIAGALEQGSVLSEQLSQFRDRSSPSSLSAQYDNLGRAITEITTIIEDVNAIGAVDRDAELTKLLVQFDPAYASARSSADAIAIALNDALVARTQASAGELTQRRQARLVVLGLFVFTVLAIWLWASRQISRPLGELAAMANESTAKNEFSGVNNGPREVVNLSRRFKTLTERLVHQATHDPLTNLVNRRELERLLEEWTKETSTVVGADSTQGVICYIDLDRFKLVNDSCGHAAGDELLRQVAEVFRGTLRYGDIIARLGGDEFCLVLKNCDFNKGMDIAELVRHRIDALRFEFKEQVFRISASIGVARIASSGASCDSIIDQADSACSVAKESGRNRIYVFDLLDKRVDQRRLDTVWVNELTLALEEQRLVLFRQPITALYDGVEGRKRFEILVRMRGTDGSLVPPSRFLPVAERYNLSVRIDKWVLQATLDWLSNAHTEREALDCCSINLSGDSLSQPEFLDYAIAKIKESQVRPASLCFEVTETKAIDDIDAAQNFMRSLSALGCQFALDDFGTGHSSFQYLRDLPVAYVKIDGSFVKNVLDNDIDAATVASLVEVSKACGKKTVAEYVESGAILDWVRDIGVDFAQGYHCGKPVEIGRIEEMEFSNVVNL